MPDKCTHADYLTTNMYCLECDRDVSNYYVGRHLYDAQVKRNEELETEVVRLTDSVDTLEDEVLSLEETLLDYEQDQAQEYAT